MDLGQQLGGPFVKHPALIGQPGSARAALEQAQAEAGLELHHTARQRGLGAAGRPRGATEPAVPGDQIEVRERQEIHG